MPSKKENGNSDEQDVLPPMEKMGSESKPKSEDPETQPAPGDLKPGGLAPENLKKEAPEKKSVAGLWKKSYPRMALLIGLAAAAGLIVSALIFFGERSGRPFPQEDTAHPALSLPRFYAINKGEGEKATLAKPVFEVYAPDQAPDKTPESESDKAPVQYPGKAAIIIDDLGCDMAVAKRILELDAKVTLSALPYCPFTTQIIDLAGRKGFETMLHLPMEPNEYPRFNPGPGSLLIYMAPEELTGLLLETLDSMPGIKGVNNHMGSKMTASSGHMDAIFSTLKDRGLFFIDSRTTSKSECRPSARKAEIRSVDGGHRA